MRAQLNLKNICKERDLDPTRVLFVRRYNVAVMEISFLMRFFKFDLFFIRVSCPCILIAFPELGGLLR